MIKRLLRDPVARDAFEAAMHAEDFLRFFDVAFTGGARTTNWSRGEDVIALVTDSTSGAAMFIAKGPNEERVTSAIGAFVELETREDAIRAAVAAKTSVEKIRRVLRLGLASREERMDDEARAIVKALLLDQDKPVRWAALVASFGLLDPSLDEAVAESARMYTDMARGAARWSDARRQDEAAKRKAASARAEQERLASLPMLALERAWDALLEATSIVIANEPKLASGYFYRALALEGLGRPAAALPLLHAARVLGREEDRPQIGAPIPRIAAKIGACTEAMKEDLAESLAFVHERLRAAASTDGFSKVLREISAAVEGARRELSLALAASLVQDAEDDAAEAVQSAAAFFPERAEAAYMIAELRAHQGEMDGAFPEYRRALELVSKVDEGSGELGRASRLHALVGSKLDPGVILSTLMQRALDHHRHDVLLDAAERAITIHADDVFALQNRGVALTFLERHEQAIAAYGEALAVMDRVFSEEGEPDADPRGLMRFNRACELARLGRSEEALADLADAVRIDESWGKKARKDDYFRSLWADREFTRIAAGFGDEAPTETGTRALVERCLGHFYRGEADEALEAGEEAEAAAEVLGDPALLSDARKTYGNALTYLRGPSEGIPKLESAVELAARAYPDEPARRAEARHLLGAAFHAAHAFEQAATCYREALEERKQGFGEAHWQLAKSYGDIARLEADRGMEAPIVAATIERGRGLLRAFLETNPPSDDRIEALFDLATLSSNLGVTWLDAGEIERALVALEETTEKLGVIVAASRRPSPSLTKNVVRHVMRLVERADERQKDRASALFSRLFEILEPSPRVRAERMYWAALRAGARELVAQGASPADIARAMQEALRGGDVPEPVRSHPAFANLSLELATRLGQRGDIVLIAMALSTAQASGELDESLERLEGLAVAEVEMSEGVIADDELDDED